MLLWDPFSHSLWRISAPQDSRQLAQLSRVLWCGTELACTPDENRWSIQHSQDLFRVNCHVYTSLQCTFRRTHNTSRSMLERDTNCDRRAAASIACESATYRSARSSSSSSSSSMTGCYSSAHLVIDRNNHAYTRHHWLCLPRARIKYVSTLISSVGAISMYSWSEKFSTAVRLTERVTNTRVLFPVHCITN